MKITCDSWYAPKSSSAPVYCLYNRGLGDHHYTVSKTEANALVKKYKWKNEGIAWYAVKLK